MEVSGKIIQILPEQTGTSARGEWSRQDFIIETNEQYPKKICISNWGKKADLGAAPVGTEVTCHINIESREFNNRWYTDVKVWKMEIASAGSASAAPGGDAPFPSADNMPFDAEEGDEELPF